MRSEYDGSLFEIILFGVLIITVWHMTVTELASWFDFGDGVGITKDLFQYK